MKNDKEYVSAYLDGELDKQEQQELESRLEKEAGLRKILSEFTLQQNLLKIGADIINSSPVPDNIAALLQESTSPKQKALTLLKRILNIIDLKSPVVLTSVSAMLLGFLLLPQLLPQSSSLAPELHAFLDQPGAITRTTTIEGVYIEQRLAYRSQTGSLCKLYEVQDGENQSTNVACLHETQWKIAFQYESLLPPQDQELYAPANSSLVREVEEFIQADIDGSPLSTKQEQQLLHASQPK